MIDTVTKSGIIMVKTLLQNKFSDEKKEKKIIANFYHLCYDYISKLKT